MTSADRPFIGGMVGVILAILALIATVVRSGFQRAWVTACRLAVSLGAELVLLHVLRATPVEMNARYALEEARAAEQSRPAEHQLGIAREDVDELPRLPYRFSGPLTGERVSDFSLAGGA